MTPWYASKTVWLNLITTLVGILTLVPQFDFLPPDAAKWSLLAVGALNVILRVWFTDSPVRPPFGKRVKL